jgi:hypothetical protein
MWGNVIVCLVAMGLDERAERLVCALIERQPSPSLYCSLALLRDDESLYLKAWELSGGRCARAMRDLARLEHKRGDHDACATHMRMALELNNSRVEDWFLIGCVRMKQMMDALKDAKAARAAAAGGAADGAAADSGTAARVALHRQEALEAFLRAVRRKPRYWQAWGNISAIHMTTESPRPAFIAIKEAIKYTTMVKQWKLTANAIVIASSIGEHDYVCEACMTLLKTKAGKSANNTDSGMNGFLTVVGVLDGLIDATEPAAGEEEVEDASAGECAAAEGAVAEGAATRDAEEASAGDAPATAATAAAPSEDVFALLESLERSGGILDAEEEGSSSGSGRAPFAAVANGDVGTAAFEAHTVLMAGKLRRKVQKLLAALAARVSDSAVLWGSCARFCGMHGDVDGALTAKQTQCRLLKSRPEWKKTAAVYAQMIAATLDLCELYIAEVRSSASHHYFCLRCSLLLFALHYFCLHLFRVASPALPLPRSASVPTLTPSLPLPAGLRAPCAPLYVVTHRALSHTRARTTRTLSLARAP